MKCFTYFLCFWFAFLTVGCASHRSEIPVAADQGTTACTDNATPSDAPSELPAPKHEPLEGLKTLAVAVVGIPLLIVFVPALWVALVIGSK